MNFDHGVGDMPDDKNQRKEGILEATADDTLHLGRKLYARHAAFSNVNTIGRDTINRYGSFLSRFAPSAADRWNLARESWNGRPNLEWLRARDNGRNQIRGSHGFTESPVLSRGVIVPSVQHVETPIPAIAAQGSYSEIEGSSSHHGDRPKRPTEASSDAIPTHSELSATRSTGPAQAHITRQRFHEIEPITSVPLEPTHQPGGEPSEMVAAPTLLATSGLSSAENRNMPVYLGPPIYQRSTAQRQFVTGRGADTSNSAGNGLNVDRAGIRTSGADGAADLAKGQPAHPVVQAQRTFNSPPSLPFVQGNSAATPAGHVRGKGRSVASLSMRPTQSSGISRQADGNRTTSANASHSVSPGAQEAVWRIHFAASDVAPSEGAHSSHGFSLSAPKPEGPSNSPALFRAPGSSTEEFLRSRSSTTPLISAAQSLGQGLLNRHRESFITHSGNIGEPMRGGAFDRPVIQRVTQLGQEGQAGVKTHSTSGAPTAASSTLPGGSAELTAIPPFVDKTVETHSVRVVPTAGLDNPQVGSVEVVGTIQPFVDKTVETHSVRVAQSTSLDSPQDRLVEHGTIEPFVDVAGSERQSDSPVKERSSRLVHSEAIHDKSDYRVARLPAIPAEPERVVPEIGAGTAGARRLNRAISEATGLTHASSHRESPSQAGSGQASRAPSETPIVESESSGQSHITISGTTHPAVRAKVDKSVYIGKPSTLHRAPLTELPTATTFGTHAASTSPSPSATPHHADASLTVSKAEQRPHPARLDGLFRVASDPVGAVPVSLISRRYEDSHRGNVMFGQAGYSRAVKDLEREPHNDADSNTIRVAQMPGLTPEHTGHLGTYAESATGFHAGSHRESLSLHRSYERLPGLDGSREALSRAARLTMHHALSPVPRGHAYRALETAQSSTRATGNDNLFRAPADASPTAPGTASAPPSVSSAAQPISGIMQTKGNIDVTALANRVYELLVRRLSSERQRRGA